MLLPLFIAKRYLFGKKSKNVINYISAISVTVVAIVTMALFVALSVFNGLEGLIQHIYQSFDPDIKITPLTGKVFIPDARFQKIIHLQGVISSSETLEEDVLLKYADKQFIGRIKGVSNNFNKTTVLDKNMIAGSYHLQDSSVFYTVIGQGVSYSLSVALQQVEPIQVYVPSRTAKTMAAPDKSFKHTYVYPVGVFQSQPEIDAKYIITTIGFARNLLEYKNHEVSAIELKVDTSHIDDIKQQIAHIAGSGFAVKDRFEQHEFVFKVLKSEKWGVFLIVSFILFIASFNVVGSLTMLIIDKSKDILILKSMGANDRLIKRIFLFEGWMISVLGACIGLAFGFVICWLQMRYGIIRLGGSGNFIVDAYPVLIKGFDVFSVFCIVLFIGFIAAYIPVWHIKKRKLL